MKKDKNKVLADDFSNRTVLMTLVVVIVISVVSLGGYLAALDAATPIIGVGTFGQVGVTILATPDGDVVRDLSTVASSGKVGVEILK